MANLSVLAKKFEKCWAWPPVDFQFAVLEYQIVANYYNKYFETNLRHFGQHVKAAWSEPFFGSALLLCF